MQYQKGEREERRTNESMRVERDRIESKKKGREANGTTREGTRKTMGWEEQLDERERERSKIKKGVENR